MSAVTHTAPQAPYTAKPSSRSTAQLMRRGLAPRRRNDVTAPPRAAEPKQAKCPHAAPAQPALPLRRWRVSNVLAPRPNGAADADPQDRPQRCNRAARPPLRCQPPLRCRHASSSTAPPHARRAAKAQQGPGRSKAPFASCDPMTPPRRCRHGLRS